jgi:integrase
VHRPDWAAIAAAESQAVEIPEADRTAFSESTTVRQFYANPRYGLEAQRRARVSAGTLAAGTIAKDRQAINRWEVHSQRPPNWPAGQAWQGRPLAWITDQHVTDTLSAMRTAELSGQTIRSTWAHLRTIFHHAVEVKALERAPEPTWGKDHGAAAGKEMYGDEQLGTIYAALAGDVDLQVAFVVSVNVGPRTVDLFLLRWENFALHRDRPVVEYTARKTGKRHCVPLAAVTVEQLERWRKVSGALGESPLAGASGLGGLVWPGLTDPEGADPERSRPARSRNARFKRLLAGLGICHEKPWQVGRLTCNERLERHRPGAGQFVLGHANSLNSVSYREPSGLVWEAVRTLPQPGCFSVGGQDSGTR